MPQKTITVNASGKYDVIIGSGLLMDCGEYVSKVTNAERTVIISDSNVFPIYGEAVKASLEKAGFKVSWFTFPRGEKSKNSRTLFKIWDFLSKLNFTRSDCIIALGGGVAGDIAGFAAATYLRGVDFIQLPTSLLAQVDSSVGGKTAIDLEGGKNLVGAFRQPKLVLCDVDTLDTLSPKFFTDGMGEVVKYGMIKSDKLFAKLEQHTDESLRADKEALTDIIAECIDIKRAAVEADEFDGGERMVLNFGHTLGHAIEKYYGYSGITHGVAVSAGMKFITEMAEKHGLAEAGTYVRLKKCLARYGLDIEVEPELTELASACLNDKKRFGDSINIVICCDVGASMIKKLSVDAFFAMIAETR